MGLRDRVKSGSRKARARAAKSSRKAKARAKSGAQWAVSTTGKTYRRAGDVAKAGADEVVGVMESGVDNVLDRALDYAGTVVKNHIKDPDMPGWIQRGVDDVVDDVWPDVKDETKTMAMSGIHAHVPVDHGRFPGCCPNPFAPIRAFLLYHYYPHDKTFWGSTKDPIYWILTLISMVPVFGISQMFYFILFLLIDKTDEGQLVTFILGFKGMQFLTLGVLPMMVASVQFYVCATQTNDCAKNAPGEPLWVFVVFMVQVFVVWLAFALLPCSRKKGHRGVIVRGRTMRKYDWDGDGVLNADELRAYNLRRNNKNKDEIDINGPGSSWWCCCCECFGGRGGRLRFMVLYDMITFFLAVAVIVIPIFAVDRKGTLGEVDDDWKSRATIYFGRILYGLLSFPFVIFNLPMMERFLTHAKPTAYNRNGVTVPYIKPKGSKKAKQSDEEAASEESGQEETNPHNDVRFLQRVADKFHERNGYPTRDRTVPADSDSSDSDDDSGSDGYTLASASDSNSGSGSEDDGSGSQSKGSSEGDGGYGYSES